MTKGKAEVIYRGPYEALEIGGKRLERDGPPVALTASELERLHKVRLCHYEIAGELEIQEPQPAIPPRPEAEVLGSQLSRARAGEEE